MNRKATNHKKLLAENRARMAKESTMNKAKEFYKIHVYDITKRITPNDAVKLMELYADEVSRDSKRRHAIDFLNYMSCIEDFKDPNGLDKENAKIYDNWLKEQEEKKCKYCTIKITEGDTCFNCSIELRIKEQEEQYCPYCQATFEKCDCDEWFGNNKG